MTTNFDRLIDKYGQIIKEEVNVKNISKISSDIKIQKIYKPIGKNIGEKFAKDTGNIISLAKSGNIKELLNGQIEVYGNGQAWVLDTGDYEIAYQGIDEQTMSVSGNTIVKLDMTITTALKKEGIIREISRFINQMRKDADYKVDTRITLNYNTSSTELQEVINEFGEFLKQEALIKQIVSANEISGDIVSKFDSEEGSITFGVNSK